MKKKLAHYFRPLAAALVLAATPAAAEDPPPLKIPERFEPRVVKNVVKATAAADPNLKLSNIDEAWKKTKGEGVVLYVADTGVDLTHPEFKAAKLSAVNFTADPDATDGNGHGTFCTSEIIGRQNVDGVAPNVDRTVHLKVLSNNGSGDLDWLTKAIRYAIKDAAGKPAVFSASLGASPLRGTDSPDTNPALQAAILDGWQAGIVFVFAAGNDDSKYPPSSVGWPARYGSMSKFDGLCVVAACDLNRKITDFSSVGPATWTTAVGHDVLGALPDGKYGRWDGTSMATPIVAGIACLWLSANHHAIPPAERYRRFADECRKASSFPSQRNPARGWGLADAGKLLASAPATPVPPVPVPPGERTVTVDTPELRAQGIRRLVVVLDGAASQPSTVPVTLPARQPQPVYGQWVPPAPPWYPPVSQPLPQYMPAPQQCGPNGCPQPVPVQQFHPQWVPGQRVRGLIGR